MQRVVWLGYLSLVLAVPLGIGLGRIVGHPGDPPHIFTLLALLAGGLAAAGVVTEVADSGAGRAARVLVSAGLACYIVIATLSEPFLVFDGRTPAGLLLPTAWLVPVAAAGVWFASRRRWPQVAAALVFLAAGAALLTFNMHWHDPAGFVSKIRT
jgi:hypothetical protein